MDYAVILEDDVRLVDGFKEKVSAIVFSRTTALLCANLSHHHDSVFAAAHESGRDPG
jgi:GR25 family glycosyltransferase involved in LPS biosynthesis